MWTFKKLLKWVMKLVDDGDYIEPSLENAYDECMYWYDALVALLLIIVGWEKLWHRVDLCLPAQDEMFHKVVLFLFLLKVASTKYRETIDWTIEFSAHTGLMMNLLLMSVLR